MHVLSLWNPPSSEMEMGAVTSVPVLQLKMRSLSRLVCVLSQREVLKVLESFLPFLPVLFCGGPSHLAVPCLVRLS